MSALLLVAALAAGLAAEIPGADLEIVSAESPLDPGEIFVAANTAYGDADYDAAVAGYKSLLEQGWDRPELHYNLGNAYLRRGELGGAISSYRRAESGLPRDQDVQANLDFARKSSLDALAPPEPTPLLRTLLFWHYALSRAELWRVVIVLNLALWLILSLRLFRRSSELLRWASVLLALGLVASASSLAVRTFSPRRVAVVLPQEVEVYSGMRVDGVVRFKLHSGSEVRVEESAENWFRVGLPDGQQGWIEAEFVEVVEL